MAERLDRTKSRRRCVEAESERGQFAAFQYRAIPPAERHQDQRNKRDMSVTTTSNVVSTNVLHLLADYEIHQTGTPESASHPNPQPVELNTGSDRQSDNNPPWWDRNHRRVPPYRPLNQNLDLEERPDGINTVERLFIFTMLNGVGINAGIARLWRLSGGRFKDRIFRYRIGGEM
ncbi:hypothetical protein RBB50_009400 [Rhinocladiella similis]